MPRYRVLPCRQGSRSARALADALGGRVLRLEGSTFRPRHDDIIVNWGNTQGVRGEIAEYPFRMFNTPAQIHNCSNKLHFFRRMQNEAPETIPPFWTNQGDIPDDQFPIVCRTILAGHSGAGIVISDRRDDLVPASLYVKYIRKQDEYRVHCGLLPSGDFRIISLQRKARDPNNENPNWQVRNHDNGFIFVRGGVVAPPSVLAVAESALRAAGLDFGAVDVIFNARQERAYVLEINTAPGLEGQTIEDYADFFRAA